MTDTIKSQIVSFMENAEKKSFSMEEIAQGLHLEKAEDFKMLVQTIAKMEREKTVTFNNKGKVKLPTQLSAIEGTYRANERGFGFVTIDPEEPDVYIPKDSTGYAMDGDTVAIDITKVADPSGDRGAEGKILNVVKRHATQVVGEFIAYNEDVQVETGLYGVVKPKDKKIAMFQVSVTAEGVKPVDGSVVVVEITNYPEQGYETSLEGMVKQVIGHKNDPGMDILSVVIAHGIPSKFPEEVLAAADEVPDKISEADYKGRRDLRDQLVVTIDGADAKDLDDAVTVSKLANGNYFLGVHIADVSHYVTENNALDQEAFERATSVYLTDRVIPMIPQRLSNGICSLNPQVPRLTMSCEMEITPLGEIVKHDIFPSVIQTTERMTYEAVNAILEDNNREVMNRYRMLVPMFQSMKELHLILETMRERRGAISFEDREAKIIVDEAGHPQGIELRSRGVGERLIESFMLAANETVAKHFSTQKLPFIYRIHEQPKEEKMERFFDFAAALGILVHGTKDSITPKDLQKVIEQVDDKPESAVINTMLLRSMQQARYSEDNYGHYGLAAEYYTHFTSPIRRYPDLIVHRLIKSYARSISEKNKAQWAAKLPEIAAQSSRMERRAVEAEREVDSMKKAEYMMEHIDEEFDGIISSVTKFGLFVELPNTIEGLIHISRLEGDYYQFIENHLALVGERTKKTFKIGQKVVIKVVKADPETREIDFELLSSEEVPAIEVPKSNRRESRREDKRGERQERRNHLYDTKPDYSKDKKKKKKKKTGKKPFYQDVAKGKGKNKKGKKPHKK
jgi:ribonuclease R